MEKIKNKIVVLIWCICLFFPFGLWADHDYQMIDSLLTSSGNYIENNWADHAILTLLRALEMAKENNDDIRVHEALNLLSKAYVKEGDYETAYLVLKDLQNLRDSLSYSTTQIEYDIRDSIISTGHHEFISKLETSKKQQFNLFFIIIVVILLSASLLIIINDRHIKKKMQLVIDEQTSNLKKSNLQLEKEISEKTASEEELKESRERYKQLIDNSPSLILEFDPYTTEIINCNPAMAKSLGYSPAELIGNKIKDILPKDIFDKRFVTVKAAVQERKVKITEDCNRGHYFYNTFIPIISGNSITIQIVSYEITERKKAEMELKEHEALLQSLIYNIPLDFYARDIEGKVFMQSARSIEKWGDQTGKTVDDLFVSDSFKKMWEKWNNAVLSGNELDNEYNLMFHEKEYHIRSIKMPIRKEGEIIGLLGVEIDITEIKENEKKLLQLKDNLETMVGDQIQKSKAQQELLIQKSKLESLGQLAAGIAHEVNQPIGLIALGLDNILEKMKNDNNISAQYLRDKIDNFFKYIDRIRQIIDHIGTFSRDQKDIIFDELDINSIIEQALIMINQQYKDHNITFNINLDNNLPKILGNRFKLEQVFLNLLANSHDALDIRGKHEKGFQKEITITTCKKRKDIFVEFTDNGIGIPQKELENIFDPFYTTKGPDMGTGLGLSVSYGILEQMNASISVESTPDEFTTFTIKFKAY